MIYTHNFWGEGPIYDLYGDKIQDAGQDSFYNPLGETKLNRKLLFLVTDAETALSL